MSLLTAKVHCMTDHPTDQTKYQDAWQTDRGTKTSNANPASTEPSNGSADAEHKLAPSLHTARAILDAD
jgi:hypothetical protein